MSVVQYKCPNCGGPLEWGAEAQKFTCEFCGSNFTHEQLELAFPDLENAPLDENVAEISDANTEFTEHTSLYRCNSCGAEIIAEDTTAATFCYYCHNPTILEGRLSGDFKPSAVIPFKFNRDTAQQKFKDWCKKRWFLPSDFKSQQQLEKIAGVYIPFWLADCKLDADITALAKNVRSWRSGDTQYTETKEYQVHRNGVVDFEKIPADASQKAENELMDAIEPFNYNELIPFSMSYLSGYLAEKYDVDKLAVLPRIKARAEAAAEEKLRSTIVGYSSVTITSRRINVIRTDWKYTLLPVWFMTYKHNGKSFYFAINGQTGKLSGTPPISYPKVLAFCSGLAVLLGIIGFFIGGGI